MRPRIDMFQISILRVSCEIDFHLSEKTVGRCDIFRVEQPLDLVFRLMENDGFGTIRVCMVSLVRGLQGTCG